MYPGRGLGAQVGHEPADLLVGAVPADRRVARHLFPSAPTTQVVHTMRVHRSGADAVHVYAVRTQLPGHGRRHADDGEVCGVVGQGVGAPPLSGRGRYVDDLPSLALAQ